MIEENKPVYFFDHQTRTILEGRLFCRSSDTNDIVEIDGINYYTSSRFNFTHDRKKAKREAVKFFKAEIAEHRAVLTKLYRELFNAKYK